MPKVVLYVICGVLFVGFVAIWEKHNEEILELEQALSKERNGEVGYKKELDKALSEIDDLKAQVEKSQAVLQQCVKEVEVGSSISYISNALKIKR